MFSSLYWNNSEEILLNRFSYKPSEYIVMRRLDKLMDWQFMDFKKQKEVPCVKPTNEGLLMILLPGFSLEEINFIKLCDDDDLVEMGLFIVLFSKYYNQIFYQKSQDEEKNKVLEGEVNQFTQKEFPKEETRTIEGDIELTIEILGCIAQEDEGKLINACYKYGCSRRILDHIKHRVLDILKMINQDSAVKKRFIHNERLKLERRMYRPGNEDSKKQRVITLNNIFAQVFETNKCRVIDESKGGWFYSLNFKNLAMISQVNSLNMKHDENLMVARHLLSDTEGLLKAVFCVPLPGNHDSNGEVEEEAAWAMKAQPKIKYNTYDSIDFDMPSLFIDQINQQDADFNEARVIFKLHFKDLRAYIADEQQEKNFIIFLPKDNSEKEQLEISNQIDSLKASLKSFFRMRHTVERYREGIYFAFNPKGILVDILKYDESFNIEISGEFKPDFLQEKFEKLKKQDFCFLAHRSEYSSHAKIYFSSKKEAVTMRENLNSNINIEKSSCVFRVDSEFKVNTSVK